MAAGVSYRGVLNYGVVDLGGASVFPGCIVAGRNSAVFRVDISLFVLVAFAEK